MKTFENWEHSILSNLFVKLLCDKSVKMTFAPSVGGGVGSITILCIEKGPRQFCETSAMITNCVTDSSRWFYDVLWTVGDW